MKKNTRARKRMWIILSIITVIVIVAGFLVFVLLNKQGVFDNNQSQQDSGLNNSSNNNDSNNMYDENEKHINDPQTKPENQSSQINGFITSKNVLENYLMLRIQINELLPEGNCLLELSGNGNLVTKTSEIINSATSSSCYGFDIPLSELSNGIWQVKITIKSGDRIGIISGDVTI